MDLRCECLSPPSLFSERLIRIPFGACCQSWLNLAKKPRLRLREGANRIVRRAIWISIRQFMPFVSRLDAKTRRQSLKFIRTKARRLHGMRELFKQDWAIESVNPTIFLVAGRNIIVFIRIFRLH